MMEIRDVAEFGDVQANITMRIKVPLKKALPPTLTKLFTHVLRAHQQVIMRNTAEQRTLRYDMSI